MAWLEIEGSTLAGSGTAIHSEQGALLTPAAGAITVTDGSHQVATGTLGTINGGVASSLYVLMPTGAITISGKTNLSTNSTSWPSGSAVFLWFDGTNYMETQPSALSGILSLALGGTGSNLSATGGTNQVLKQASAGAAITVGTLAAANLTDGTTGTGSIVLATSPTLVTPTLGVATATSVNKVAFTAPASAATLTIANNKTLTASNTLTLAAGADSTTQTFPTQSTGVIGLLNESTNIAQTSTGTAEQDLFSYTLPASTLIDNGRQLRIVAWGTTAANANTKTIRFKFGSTSIVLNNVTAAPNATNWRGAITVTRIDATNQYVFGDPMFGSTQQVLSIGASTETLANAITIKITGQDGTSSAGDITLYRVTVEYL